MKRSETEWMGAGVGRGPGVVRPPSGVVPDDVFPQSGTTRDWREGLSVYRYEAMATWFQLWIDDADRDYGARAAAAAFQRLERMEQWLSRYRENSDVSRVNRWARERWVPVNPVTFRLLERCLELEVLTEGSFSAAAGPATVVGSYPENPAALGGFHPPSAISRLSNPNSELRAPYRRSEGSEGVEPPFALESVTRGVRLCHPEARLDLGGIGKGYGLDAMGEVLRGWDLERAFLVGGGSSFLALKAPRGREGWPVWLPGRREFFPLNQAGLGVSGQERGVHILDPRTGRWAEERRTAWCVAGDATMADALSTALMVLENGAIQRVSTRLGACEVGVDGVGGVW